MAITLLATLEELSERRRADACLIISHTVSWMHVIGNMTVHVHVLFAASITAAAMAGVHAADDRTSMGDDVVESTAASNTAFTDITTLLEI
jgi:hypothetical protein